MTKTDIQNLRERAAQRLMSGMFTDLWLGMSPKDAVAAAGNWVLPSITAADVMELCDLAEQALGDEE